MSGETGNGDGKTAAARTGFGVRLAGTHRRFRANVASGHAFVRARRSRRAVNSRLHGVRYFIVAAFLVALAAIVFDLPIGLYHDQWPPEIARIGRDITNIGKSGWILIPTGVAILVAYSLDWQDWRARRRAFVVKWMAALGFIFFSIAAGGLIADVFKYSIGRARPQHFHDLGAFSFHPFHDASYASFPSGHATTIGGLFAALALLFPRLRIPFFVVALWLAFTRVVVDAHYPSDVVAGLAWGAWFSYFSAVLFARHGLIFTLDGRGWPVRRVGYRPFGRLWFGRRLRRRPGSRP